MCNCEDWEPNLSTINLWQDIYLTNFDSIEVKPFQFCPWCGKELSNEQQAKIEKIMRDYPIDEITTNPIFVLQRWDYVITDIDQLTNAGYDIDNDGNIYQKIPLENNNNNDNNDNYIKSYIDFKNAHDIPGIFLYTHNPDVTFFTRAESEYYLKKNLHHYPNNSGYIYCTSAFGKLATLLEQHTLSKKEIETETKEKY
jgi:hypothetical protein